jgi:hypothetical protein
LRAEVVFLPLFRPHVEAILVTVARNRGEVGAERVLGLRGAKSDATVAHSKCALRPMFKKNVKADFLRAPLGLRSTRNRSRGNRSRGGKVRGPSETLRRTVYDTWIMHDQMRVRQIDSIRPFGDPRDMG